MAEGLTSDFYNYFLGLLWGDSDSTLAKEDVSIDSEWESFRRVIMNLCRKSNNSSQRPSSSDSHSSWDFLLNSRYHKQYYKNNTFARSFPGTSVELQGTDPSASCSDRTGIPGKSFYLDLLKGTLDSLHAVYENLKLDVLRKR